MRKIIFDIETQDAIGFDGKTEASMLDISVLSAYDSETNLYTSYLIEDLPKLWPALENADMLIGFNSDHFDIPLLNKYYPGDLTKIKSLDILGEIKKTFGRRMKLDQIAEGTLGKGKAGHGLDAVFWWKKGEIEKIKLYCEDDVRITKEIYEYALANQKLLFKEGGKINEIKLDTSEWEKPNENKLTFTLPF